MLVVQHDGGVGRAAAGHGVCEVAAAKILVDVQAAQDADQCRNHGHEAQQDLGDAFHKTISLHSKSPINVPFMGLAL